MRNPAILALSAMVLTCGVWSRAEAPKMPAPVKEHEWLKQLTGEWDTEAEMVMGPGKPPEKSRGTESTRMLGGFWMHSELNMDCMGTPLIGHMTVGYDVKKKKYVGTWVCSMCDMLSRYEGSAEGNVLTLECEGLDPATGKLVKMKDVIELKGKDKKVLTSSLQGQDGKWVVFMTLTGKTET